MKKKVLKISFQGALGSYSHQASTKFFKDPLVIPCDSFEEAIETVRKGKADKAILPVDNSTYGRVADIHSLLPASKLFITAEYFLPVDIHILGTKSSSLKTITTATSHPVLLGQCKQFLKINNIKPISGYDTAGSARLISEENNQFKGALASKIASKIYGLKILQSNVQDNKDNTTRFLVMEKKPKNLINQQKKIITSIVFQVRNIPAALYKAMGGFATNNVNMIKLESYMLGGSFEATQFFVDIQGHPLDGSVKRALDELRYFTNKLDVIGVYQQSSFRDKNTKSKNTPLLSL
ncbi:prephenate dehydratase [Paracoccaceae bacterium]|nr:prephenate dehydratase [Paracoccaceae bacterium]